MVQQPWINHNGKLIAADAAIATEGSHGFRYGNSLIETMLVRDGAIRLEAYHWERLLAGMETLGMRRSPHFTGATLHDAVLQTVKKNKQERLCRVRLQVYCGSGGLYEGAQEVPQFAISCHSLEAAQTEFNENGLVVGIAIGLAKSMDSLANLKSSNALIYLQAARQATANRWNDALVLNNSGRIAESTIANIFWVSAGRLYTPPLSEGCVAGVMRRYLLNELNGAITEQALTEERLQTATEIFLTNAVRGVKWVGKFENHSLKCEMSHYICSRISKTNQDIHYKQ